MLVAYANVIQVKYVTLIYIEHIFSNSNFILTLKAPITTAVENNFSFSFFRELNLEISCESSAKLMIHMKCQDLFSLKNNNK